MDPKPTVSRTQWVIALCAAAGLAVMAGVIVLAQKGVDPTDPPSARGLGTPGNPRLDGGGGQPGGTVPGPAINPASAAACGPLDPDNPPKLVFDLPGPEVEFGTLKQGVQLERIIKFRNDGSGPLCIYSVKTGCGCLKAELVSEKRRFEPGETGSIRLKIDTTGRLGRIRKSVTVMSNDPDTPSRSIPVVMDVNAGLIVDPRYVQFGNVTLNTPASRDLIVRTPASDPPWEVTEVTSGRPIFGDRKIGYTWTVEPVADPNLRKVRLTITHPGLDVLGAFTDTIEIHTSHPDRPKVSVQTQINVLPRILSRSRVISLGYVTAGNVRAPSRARVQGGTPLIQFEITAVEVLPGEGREAGPAGPGFEATFGQDERGWWVDVKYDGRTRQPGLIEAVLLVHTSDAEQPELRIPIRATVQRGG